MIPHPLQFDAVVVGGGFFGCSLALHLRQSLGYRVALVEREPELLGRASYVNQARVHGGYHYPRSLTTAQRSQANYVRFVSEFSDCIANDFKALYAIGRKFSKVTARQFELLCRRIGAPLKTADNAVQKLFDPELIEAVFEVRECAFDAVRLRHRFDSALRETRVEVHCGTEALRVNRCPNGLILTCAAAGDNFDLVTGQVFNCTYARINKLLSDSSLPTIPLKHELAEVALVEAPAILSNCGITVMCGPFFSVMPFPARGLHSLTHVRYTPHCEWQTADHSDPYGLFTGISKQSQFPQMVKDAKRYVPVLGECRYVESLYEIKTILPRSDHDDSRPILLGLNHGLPGLTCVTGAKLDNVYDMLDFFQPAAAAARSAS